ncbi:hypothetical protein ABPG74_009448 [Tetrahymena malaccensis]
MDMIFFPNTLVKSNDNTYQIIKTIGKGQFGVVYLAINQKSQQQVAVKQIYNKPLENPKVKELLNQELSIQKLIKSRHTVQIIENFFDQNLRTHIVIQEYCDEGDLDQYIAKYQSLPEAQAISYLKQLLQAFKDLHAHNCMHRDIKPNNILFSKGLIKLGDFGFAKQLDEFSIAKTSLGTTITMAPEVFNQEEYSFEADMFSLGIVFYFMLFGQYPYKPVNLNPHQFFKQVQAQNINFNLNGITVSQNTQDLIKRMTAYDRKQRITWLQIYQHPALQEQQSRFPQEVMRYDMLQTNNSFNRGINEEFYQINGANLQKQIFKSNDGAQVQKLSEIKLEFLDNVPNQDMQVYQQQQIQQQQLEKDKIAQQQKQLEEQKQKVLQQQIEEQQQKQKLLQQQKELEEQKQKILQKQKEEEQQKQLLLIQQRNEDFQIGMQKYFHKRNTNCILIQMLNSIRNLKDFKINYQIPAFLTCKKLIKLIKEYRQTLLDKNNIFGMAFFQDFVNSNQYQDLIQMSNADLEKVRQEYPQILQECKDSIKKLRMNNAQLLSHLASEECNSKFELQYKECLINYSISLRELKTQEQTEQQRNLFHHIVLISDIARIDTFEKNNFNFNFEIYKKQVYQTPFNQMELKLDEACQRIFQ